MINILNKASESLVIYLCEEIEYIKIRSRNINHSLKLCQNKFLIERLKVELAKLNTKKAFITNVSERLYIYNCNDLSLELLKEVIRRSNSYQQI